MSERDVELEAALEAARSVVTKHVGGRLGNLAHEPTGLSNVVFTVEHAEGDLVVRLSADPTKGQVFRREHWAMVRARAAGVPSPEVLAIGEDSPFAYMLVRRVAGRTGLEHPERERVVREMGEYAAVINSISTSSHGSTLECMSEPWATPATFHEFLHDELELDARLETLATARVLPEETLARISAVLEAAPSRPPLLNHGDLRLKNVLVNDSGHVAAILDWEHCVSTLAPEWEWSVALHDLSIDEKEAFIQGYGAPAASVLQAMPVVKALNLLNYAPKVARRLRAGDESSLARLRVRLQATLDLFAL